MGGMPIVLDS
ncbi:hypothetical protein LINPERPRIM_LOCUS14773 [Linum perenne]